MKVSNIMNNIPPTLSIVMGFSGKPEKPKWSKIGEAIICPEKIKTKRTTALSFDTIIMLNQKMKASNNHPTHKLGEIDIMVCHPNNSNLKIKATNNKIIVPMKNEAKIAKTGLASARDNWELIPTRIGKIFHPKKTSNKNNSLTNHLAKISDNLHFVFRTGNQKIAWNGRIKIESFYWNL